MFLDGIFKIFHICILIYLFIYCEWWFFALYTQEYFTNMTAVSFVVGGNRAVRKRNPRPSAGYWKTFQLTAGKVNQHELDSSSLRPRWRETAGSLYCHSGIIHWSTEDPFSLIGAQSVLWVDWNRRSGFIGRPLPGIFPQMGLTDRLTRYWRKTNSLQQWTLDCADGYSSMRRRLPELFMVIKNNALWQIAYDPLPTGQGRLEKQLLLNLSVGRSRLTHVRHEATAWRWLDGQIYLPVLCAECSACLVWICISGIFLNSFKHPDSIFNLFNHHTEENFEISGRTYRWREWKRIEK